MDIEVLKKLVIDALEDLKVQELKIVDVRGKSSITDIMVIACGTSSRHVKSLAGNIATKAKQAGHPPIGIEGESEGDWVLVDLGDVVVHVMMPEVRDFYGLEKLWETGAAEEREEGEL